MGMNRRKVLVGLGTIVAGGGVAFGSGAFSQVSAQRTVTAETKGDGNAYLDLSGDGDYVSSSGNQVEFTFNNLNENADSEFDDILTISVNADPDSNDSIANKYYIYFDDGVSGLGSSLALNFEEQNNSSTLVGSGNAVSISYNSTNSSWGSVNVRAKFNLINHDPNSIPENVTIVADDTDPTN